MSAIMITLLTILVGLGMLATLATLFMGMLGMARGSEDLRRSNTLMRWRVTIQGVTLVLFALLLFLMRG
ncbi:twin transmembrane helix small protein [Roseomonas harenae]|uniref:twin transmembrane helix small protein n=1 Tax=Muricoccus harenae TaxID=2692566 RepID=UPI001F33E3C3|nr:twin transmembrane helix small protein [Roseomonas harenae]